MQGKSLKYYVSVLLTSMFFLNHAFSQQGISNQEKYNLIDQRLQVQMDSGNINMYQFIESVESEIPDVNKIIADVAMDDPDAVDFLEKYNEIIFRMLMQSNPEAADVYSSGKHLLSTLIAKDQLVGQSDSSLNWVKWTVAGAAATFAVGGLVRMVYHTKRIRRWNQAEAAEAAFKKEFLEYSTEKQGLLLWHERQSRDFITAANGQEEMKKVIVFHKHRRDSHQAMLDNNVNPDGQDLTQQQRSAVERELKEIEEEIAGLKVKKKKFKNAMLTAAHKIKGMNVSRWARRLPAIALFFSVGTAMWAQSSTQDQRLALQETGRGFFDRMMMNVMKQPHDILTNPQYSKAERDYFYFYLSLAYFTEKEDDQDFLSDVLLGCMAVDYQPDPLRMQRNLLDILFNKERYVAFQDARRDMAQEMNQITSQLERDVLNIRQNNGVQDQCSGG